MKENDTKPQSIKEDYQNECMETRLLNLKYLREEIAKLSLTDFGKEIGIQKTNLSNIECGKRDLSLHNIHSYKNYFRKNFGIDVSSDFLLGYSSCIENKSFEFSKSIKLTPKSISNLKSLSDENANALNKILSRKDISEILLSISYFNRLKENG